MTPDALTQTAPLPRPSALTAAQARDPDYFPGMAMAVPLGIQHILAMFVSISPRRSLLRGRRASALVPMIRRR
jgi:hypothetical protein